MSLSAFFRWLERHFRNKALMILFLAALNLGVYALVLATGGIKYVYSHSMYIPILLAGFIFGARGGVLAGLAGGVVLGPFMPIETATGEPQLLLNWLYRTGLFTLIGLFNGVAVEMLRRQLRENEWLARHDPFTRLPNRVALMEYIEASGREGGEAGTASSALFAVFAENLMEAGATFGVRITDEIMVQMHDRLQGLFPHGTPVFSTQPGELSVILPCGGAEEARDEMDRISAAMKEPFVLPDMSLHVEAVAGCVMLEKNGEDGHAVLRKADIAAHSAGRKGQESLLYDSELDGTIAENLEMLGALKGAMEKGELLLHYQPKVSMRDGRVVGAESLLRWGHPVRGLVYPASFVPQAEKSNLMNALTEWVINEALDQSVRWRKEGIVLSLAVNVSARDLTSPRFAEMILEALARRDLDGDSLELEITESAIMEDPLHATGVLKRFSDVRVVISIDDFGTGYSSLQYLSRFPATVIKVDQSFVRNLRSDDGARHIIDAAVRLAHALGMEVVVEGVESEETFEMLREMGCDIAQGYGVSPPLSVDEFRGWYFGRTMSG